LTLAEEQLARLGGRTAWITGGRRIGRTVARALAEQGVNLVLSYRRSVTEAEETAEAARRLGVRAITVQADVSSRTAVTEAVQAVRAEFPEIHILLNMASVYRPMRTERVSLEDWLDNFGAHVLGTFWPSEAILPLMPPGSHIVNVADATALTRTQKHNMPYMVTKAAVAAMTRAMALEYGEKGIFVNAIAPGPILPPEDYPRDRWESIRGRSPIKYAVDDREAIDQFAMLVLYLSLTTMSSGHIYPLDQGQNLF
jgi:NAD(P)-dependent dehydrogenase (short-subunit alcohol dehydrogenase family)